MLVGLLLLTLGVGAWGGMQTAPNIPGWYAQLEKPPFNPPSAVFGPVWTLLYALMAVAAWRVWSKVGFQPNWAILYTVQLVLNFAWSWIFFGMRRPDLALVEIVFLLASIALTQREFSRHDQLAGQFFIPYLAWVCFATVLNASIWWLNR